MRIPIIDLKAQYETIKEEIDAAIQGVINQGKFILGPEVEAFEREIAAYCGTEYAVGVASGTDALRLALLACNIQPGDEVITTPFTFVSTVEVIVQCGAVPVFVDIDPQTLNIDPGKVEEKITPRTRVILPVHLYGQSADMEPLINLAGKHNLKVIEDCAQSLGAQYKGKKTGSLGDAGCLSFFPSKSLGAYGDGGMVVTSNADIAEAVKSLRKHGARSRYYYDLIGFNSRLDSLQAAILRAKLKHLDTWNEARLQKAALYNGLLSEIDGIQPAMIREYGIPSFNYYTVRLNGVGLSRDALREHLSSTGVQTIVYYPLSLHLQRAYKHLGYGEGDFPESEQAQREVITLPMYPELGEEQIYEIVAGIRGFIETHEQIAVRADSYVPGT